MGTKMRNLLTSNGMYHLKTDVDRLYVPRRYRGRGMIQMKMIFKITTIGLHKYLPITNDWMLQLDHVNIHQRLCSLCLKAETEEFIIIAQYQSLFIRNYQARIIKNVADPKLLNL